jgi:hypothetical protein
MGFAARSVGLGMQIQPASFIFVFPTAGSAQESSVMTHIRLGVLADSTLATL